MRAFRLPLQISERKTLLVVVDMLLVISAVFVALWLWALRDPLRSFSKEFILSQAHWFPILTILWFLAASLNDFYNLRVADYLRSNVAALLRVTILVFLAYLVIYFFSPPQSLPRGIVLYHGVASFSLVGLWRGTYAFLLGRTPFQTRTLVVGAGLAGCAIVSAIRENARLCYRLLGYIDDDPAKQGQIINGLPVIGNSHNLLSLVEKEGVSEVILATTRNMPGELIRAIMDCQERGIRITPMQQIYEEITGRVPVEHIGENWPAILPMNHAATGNLFPLVKLAIDVAIATIGLLIFAVLFPFIALAIYLDSGGLILYSQERVGKAGQPYRLIKLRTMVPNAEPEEEASWAREKDPRVTRVGRFLRLTRLDELPQFINVLRGEMSIVGPRPERPELALELEKHIPFYRARHAVKPGMAGWALVNFGYGDSVEDALIKLEYDLYYIKHQSIYLDLLILFKTIGAMLASRGR
jgi:exopolysaccharide biosynthesis polyprenyl glycosylphosphotransferase